MLVETLAFPFIFLSIAKQGLNFMLLRPFLTLSLVKRQVKWITAKWVMSHVDEHAAFNSSWT